MLRCVESLDNPSMITSVYFLGMWANQNTYINVTFDAASQGQLAMQVRSVGKVLDLPFDDRVVYEWSDVQYLGKITSITDDQLPVGFSRTLSENLACTMAHVDSTQCYALS